MNDVRPKWVWSGITEKEAMWFYNNTVVRIDSKYVLTGTDTADVVITLYTDGGNNKHRVGKTFTEALPDHVNFHPTYNGILHLDKWVADSVRELIDWDNKHRRDLAEYARLKKKLGK